MFILLLIAIWFAWVGVGTLQMWVLVRYRGWDVDNGVEAFLLVALWPVFLCLGLTTFSVWVGNVLLRIVKR